MRVFFQDVGLCACIFKSTCLCMSAKGKLKAKKCVLQARYKLICKRKQIVWSYKL